MKKFYITTAIDYPNSEPHIGHAYQKVIADVFARWHKLLGEDVWFLTGTDEHGKKIKEAAEKQNKTPKQFVDELAESFKESWKLLNVEPSRFIRTTDKDHEKLVQDVLKKCFKKGDIYKGEYEGLYCVGCEAYYTEKELINNKCPLHNRPLEKIKEESYFFKLSKYEKFLLDLYKKNPKMILPTERKNEMVNRIKEGLRDLSISRTSFDWGIPLPFDKKHVTYVWFDALFNYISGAGKNQKYWPATIQLLGKDNGWFHTVYWPAFLKSAGYKQPKTIFIHGFLKFNNEKISKSLGNAISPKTLVEKYGADAIRYFICRNFVFGQDGDFSEQLLIERNNNELANKLGNLISRVSSLAEKHGITKTKNTLTPKLKITKIKKHIDNYELDKALNEIFSFIDICNEYIQNKKPWETKDKKVLYELADSIKTTTILLSPFIPETAEKIANQFNFKINYKNIKTPLTISKIRKSEVLFEKIKLEENPGLITMEQVKFEDWEKLDLRVGKIKSVEDIKGADKLYKITISLGKEEKTVCAGLKEHYTKEKLKNKKVILFTNLTPRTMKGIESQGMILAAVSSDRKKVSLIQPDEDIELGSRVS